MKNASIESTGTNKGTIIVNNNSFSFTIDSGKQIRITSLVFHFETLEAKISSATIRFGTTLDKDTMYDQTAKYGIIAGLSLSDTDISSKAGEYTSASTFAAVNGYACVDLTSSLKFVDEENAVVENPDGNMFQYALAITDMLDYIDKQITAACYMEYDGQLYVMNEVTYSVRSLAQEYIDLGIVTDSVGIKVINSIINY